MTAEPHPARLVKKIVICYDLKYLPPALIRSFTLLRGKIARKRLRIEVQMLPLSRLPADADVLLLPEELLEAAQQYAPVAARIGILEPTKTYQAAFDELLKDLDAGKEIYAQQVSEVGELERTGEHGGIIKRYRGNERIG